MDPHHGDDSRQNLVESASKRSAICRSSFPAVPNAAKPAHADDNAAMESHFSKENIKFRVILSLDISYLKTAPGVMKFALVILSVVSLVTVTTSGGSSQMNAYLLLPRSAFLRLFVFTATAGFLTSFLFLFIQITGLIKICQFNWHFVDILVHFFFTILYLTSSSLVMGNVVYYLHMDTITKWTKEQILLTGIIGMMCTLLSCVLAINGYVRYRGSSQFRRFRLQELERLERLHSLETV